MAPPVKGAEIMGEVTIRACVLNFVVVLLDGYNLPEISNAVLEVAKSHPARVIFVTVTDDKNAPPLRTWIAESCNPVTADGIRVCHEEIHIVASKEGMEQIDNAVFSLLIPDLPTFLWWQSPFPEDEPMEQVFSNLVDRCDRLIIDSTRLLEPSCDLSVAACLASIAGEGEEELRHIAVGDLTWQRLLPWLSIVVKCFDLPQALPLLSTVKQITIKYAEVLHGGNFIPTQALLLLGWIASRLQWVPEKNGFVSSSNPVKVIFNKEGNCSSFQEEIRSIVLEMDMAKVATHLLDGGLIEGFIETTEYQSIRQILPNTTFTMKELLERELLIMGRNFVYEEALRVAAYLSKCWRF